MSLNLAQMMSFVGKKLRSSEGDRNCRKIGPVDYPGLTETGTRYVLNPGQLKGPCGQGFVELLNVFLFLQGLSSVS